MGLNQLTIEELRALLQKKEIIPMDIINDISSAIEEDKKHKLPLNVYISYDKVQIATEVEKVINNFTGTILGGIPIAMRIAIIIGKLASIFETFSSRY